MYSTLKAEMARKNMRIKDLAMHLNEATSTISKKVNGHVDFTLKEAKAIKEILSVDMPLEELFFKG